VFAHRIGQSAHEAVSAVWFCYAAGECVVAGSGRQPGASTVNVLIGPQGCVDVIAGGAGVPAVRRLPQVCAEPGPLTSSYVGMSLEKGI
jgi:hypothetical protein